MPDTLYLDPDAWDLVLDASGNIAMASEPYSLAQDAACAIRTFVGECYYDTTLGIPYWSEILGHFPALTLVKSQLVAAALTVPGVAAAQVFITGVVNRQLQGQVQVTDANGFTTASSFGATGATQTTIQASTINVPRGFEILADGDGDVIVTADGQYLIAT